MTDDLTLTVGGSAVSGWTVTNVTRGIEICPPTFNIGFTDLYPGQADAIIVHAGDPCTVHLDSDLVLTGYVDTVEPGYEGSNHEIRITGRGKCQDLVDCSAERPTGQFSGLNLLQIAQELAKPYGITVKCFGTPPVVPQFNLMIGESAWSIIERICRWAAFLCYEDVDGSLILANGMNTQAASGCTEGVNVQAAHATYTMNDRFSEYDVFLQALDVWTDAGQGGNQVAASKDPNVPRHRAKYLIAEGGAGGLGLAQPRANWEASRRYGRSRQVACTVDSWRDSSGTLWTPNTLVPLTLPSAKVPTGSNWTLGTISHSKDQNGTRAELSLMPFQAFTPEPLLLQPVDPDLTPPPAPPK